MKRYKVLIFTIAVAITAVTGAAMSVRSVHALSGGEWKAGRIIDDGVFFNGSSLNAGNIQQFLNAKVPNCDTNGTQQSTHWNSSAGRYYTRAEWGARNGNPAPYTCLRNYTQDTPTRGAEANLCNTYYGGPKSAAQIIADVAQACGVSPKVLLVLLQKEQSLVTDDWPWSNQYQKATGYGCPDTAPCDAQYNGFFNQVYNAARIYKKYARDAGNYNYVAFRNNNILYNPNSGCGSSSVFIENQATAGLYIYTPYQPNQAALNNLYGSGDGCSAYGNRNFWRMFNDWFGSTLGHSYARYYSQSPAPTVRQGEVADISLSYRNDGLTTWYDSAAAADKLQSPVVLATMNPVNRGSEFYDSSTWYNSSRPTGIFSQVYEADGTTLASDQHVAKPGQIVQYNLRVRAPLDLSPGSYREYFAPIREGASDWFMGADNVFMTISVTNAFTASYVGQSSYPVIAQNDSSQAFFKFKNNGVRPWYDATSAGSNGQNPIVLAADWPINRGSSFSASWASGSRPAVNFARVYESDGTTLANDQHVAQPGQIVEYAFPLTAPLNQSPGVFREYFSLIREGSRDYRIDGATAYLDVGVRKSNFQASYVAQSSYPSIQRGGSTNVFIRYSNSGNVAWYDSARALGKLPIHLAATWPINRGSSFSASWASGSRPAVNFARVYESDGTTLANDQHVAQPGQIVEYAFPLTAPGNINPGIYKEYFQPIIEGASSNKYDIDGTVWLQVQVTP